MPANELGDLIHIGVEILKTSVSAKTKKILAQIGSNSGEGQGDADNVEWWQHVGFASRPSEPEKGKSAATAISIRSGGIDAIIASTDVRGETIKGNLQPGETCVYAAGPDGTAQARILLKADGSINIFTAKDNEVGGNGMGIFVKADGSITAASHNGAALLIKSDGSIALFNTSSGVQVKDSGIKVATGGKVEISGGSVTLGGVAALPVAIAPHVLTAITALQIEIAAVAAALVACMNIAGPILPVHGTTAASATAAVGVAAGIVGGLSAVIPAKQTSAQ